MVISSSSNERIKDIKKLYEKKYRLELNQYVVEGVKILEEAILSNQKILSLVVCEELLSSVSIDKSVVSSYIAENDSIVISVTENVFDSISDTKNPQGILAVLEFNRSEKEITDNVIFLDNIQDPGNVGTIIRSAMAFGFNTVVLNKGCVDIYNQKVLRATMGNVFKANILVLKDDGIDWLTNIKKTHTVYASLLVNAKSIYDVEYTTKKVLIVGNEANGIMHDIMMLSDSNIVIPMHENVESLNVSNAASIIMAEMAK